MRPLTKPGRLGWTVVMTIVVTAGLLACGDDHLSTRSSRPPRNLLFIIIDAASARHFSFAGYYRNTTPRFDEVAREGVLFLSTRSQAASTLPSAVSYLSGQYPGAPAPLDSEHVRYCYTMDRHSLAEAFARRGFATAGFSENPHVTPVTAFDRGFGEFRVYPTFPENLKGEQLRIPDISETLISDAKKWIRAQGEDRWFCYLHLLRPHNPYQTAEPYASRYSGEPYRLRSHPDSEYALTLELMRGREDFSQGQVQYLRDLYDGNLAYVDFLVGGLVDEIAKDGQLEDTLLIIASDHGEAFLEHGRLHHSTTVYEEMIRVPMLIRAPARMGFMRGTRTHDVEMVDLFPTLIEIFELETSDRLDGESLVPLLKSPEASHKDRSYSQTHDARVATIIRGEHKLVVEVDEDFETLRPTELFDLGADPSENVNLLPGREAPPELVELAERHLERFLKRLAAPGPRIPDDQARQLKALGYIEGDSQSE